MMTLTDWFDKYKGVKEYNGIVAIIQQWYYGSLVKDSWCATSVSYAAHCLGLLSQIGGKNENVYYMMKACQEHWKDTGEGLFLTKKQLPGARLRRGTIVFMLNSGTVMNAGSNKHVTTSYKDFAYRGDGTFEALGGNQSDGIILKAYSQSKIYAVYYPMYGEDPRSYFIGLYKNALDRKPDTAGLSNWTNGVYTGRTTGDGLVKGFYLGKEFTAKHKSNEEFVCSLYRGLLMREPDKDGLRYWLDILDAGGKREAVAGGFWGSQEFAKICEKYTIDRGRW